MPVTSGQRARFSLAGTLETVAPFIPNALVSRVALSRAASVLRSLPAALTNAMYLECRLRDGEESVDLVFRVDRDRRQLLAGASTNPGWQSVRDFCDDWCDPKLAPVEVVAHLWLEFDIATHGDQTALIPNVFACLSPLQAEMSELSRGRVVGVLDRLLAGHLPERLRGTLGRCLEALPDSGHAAYVGVMFSRPTRPVRLCVAGLEAEALATYLNAVGWDGPVGDVARAASAVPFLGPTLLHLDIGDRVLPRLGLEFAFERPCQIRGRLVESAFLQDLVDVGICTPAKRDGLLRWPGYSFESFSHELWRSLLTRRVNHVKMVYAAGAPLEAKAYLQFSHRFPARRGRLPPRACPTQPDDPQARACN